MSTGEIAVVIVALATIDALNLSEGYNESRRMNQEESREEHSNKSGPEAHLWPSTQSLTLKEENRYSPTYKSAGEVLT